MRKTIEKKCLTCNETFHAVLSEHNRGHAKYCSISCGRQGTNYVKNINSTCVYCGISFKSGSIDTKYCSKSCKSKNYRKLQVTKDHGTKSLQRILGHLPCEICGWKEAVRDIHHILPVSKGGKNTLDNVLCVCPNHHRMFHNNLVSKEAIETAFKLRLYHHPEFTYQEPDANSGN